MLIREFAHRCPECGQEHDCISATRPDAAIPVTGSLLLCVDCGCVGRFAADGAIVRAEAGDVGRLDPRIVEAFEKATGKLVH